MTQMNDSTDTKTIPPSTTSGTPVDDRSSNPDAVGADRKINNTNDPNTSDFSDLKPQPGGARNQEPPHKSVGASAFDPDVDGDNAPLQSER